ncbi:3'-5' exonuclease [Paraliomyxa miuraensis]|uniref:3'-5' exonuclease n=1 Tax=Paraliomyxa miuraensis TaxID=376150 RepID=UPI00224C96C7|nr:3'-5' exonuclease [Paraliomyxa miuraensis]MCX4244313.1 exonuclease domain-containing protein [Paraliomyxa miuraensis]
MNRPYLVVDLEATCDRPESFPRDESEIIEIGAVLVDPTSLAPLDEFQTFVRPVQHPELTPFCTELTSITQEQVRHAPMLRIAIERLRRFLPQPVTLASWGAYDRNQFRRESQRKRIGLPWDQQHLNIKESFAKLVGQRMGVGQALHRVGLRFSGTPHRGIDDARNIVRLLPFALGRTPIPS